jgi:hypothetical protein
MAKAIGLRVYTIGLHAKGNTTPLFLNDLENGPSVPGFISDFLNDHAKVIQNNDAERSWYFEPKGKQEPTCHRGYVHYGTFGFESNFIDTKTKQKKYRRLTTDIEEIPLFYEFWSPSGSKIGFAAFQSFQGRSCINLVMTQMRVQFEKVNPGFVLSFRKVLPNDAKGSALYSAPVKRLRLIKRKASGDIADRYFDNPSPDAIDIEITMSARRNKNLGNLSSLLKSLKGGTSSVLTHDGLDFPEATADIRVGNRTRRVGVFGVNSDAGVIDLTDVIVRGPDGHPTFESIKKETNEILKDFFRTLNGDKS